MLTYNYHPLKTASETRLLRLEPAARYHDQLIGSLIHTSLHSDTCTYEALSYVWNNSSNSWTSTYNWSPPAIKFAFYPLTLDDLEELPQGSYDDGDQLVNNQSSGEIICDGQTVTIGAELYDALRRLRLRDRQRMIWIDALCINQEDIIERNSQVQNMREIYNKADHVLIWVGEHFSAGPASQNMFTFILQLELLITNIMNEYGPYNLKAIEMAILNGYVLYTTGWNFLRELLSRAWFGRVWVLQEVVNAKRATLFAGSGTCDWDTLAAITKWLSMYDVNGPINIRRTICALPAIDMIWNLSRLKEDPSKPPLPPLLDVLIDSRLCRSTYPIDKVYGVLGLVSPEDASKITIDYGIEAGDLYKQIALTELSRIGLNILYFCTKSSEKSTVDCPSWVPDWSQPCYHDSFFKLKYKSSAAGKSLPSFRIEERALIVKGRIIDTIQCVDLARPIPIRDEVEPSSEKEEPEDLSKEPVFWDGDMQATDADELPPFVSSPDQHLDVKIWSHKTWFPEVMKIAFPDNKITADTYEALWRTCCCNRTSDGDVPGAEFGKCFADWTKAMNELKLRDFEEFQSNAKQFMDSFSKFCNNRRFFRSGKGRLGWGPDQTREGDIVCALSGVDVPLVLRRGGKSGFELIGDAYVHGIMDGEAMEMGLREQDVYLV